MRKPSLAWTLFAFAAACNPDVAKDEPQTAPIVARFNPAASPVVVPTPNDIGSLQTPGQVLPASTTGNPIDEEFVSYVNGLGGFPSSTSATATFTGPLDPTTVTTDSVKVFDVTEASPVAVTGYRVGYAASEDPRTDQRSKIFVIPPPAGWTPGRRYAVAVLGSGENPLKGANGEPVVAATTWVFVRTEKPLVRCQTDVLDVNTCVATTDVIPAVAQDVEGRRREQTATAIRLEGLRRYYARMLDAVQRPRADVALLWSFNISPIGTAFAFDPGVTPAQVPSPNDLAIDPTTGKVNIPIDPLASPAQQEFTRDFLNTLDGFPVRARGTASVQGEQVDRATVNASSVVVLDITNPAAPAPVAGVGIDYDPETRNIVITPPGGQAWPKGSRYAVAAISGENFGIRTVSNGQVRASLPWVLARTAHSLVTCQDPSNPNEDCQPAITATTLEPDTARRLELVRRGYSPLLDGLAALNPAFARENIGVLWTFKIVSQPEPIFAPPAILPFPNDLVRSPPFTGEFVSIPAPPPPDEDPATPDAPPETPEEQAVREFLNSLRGFSLTAPIVTENAPAQGTLDIGLVDGASVVPTTYGLLNLTPGGNTPDVHGCLNCASSESSLEEAQRDDPQQLQIVPRTSLDEKSLYGAYITTGIRDTTGKSIMAAPTFALIRLSNPLVDSAGKSQVAGVLDPEARQLEALRQAHKPFMDALAAAGVPRSSVALAWQFTTQETTSLLARLYALPQANAGLAVNPNFVVPLNVATTMGSLPQDAIGGLFAGQIELPNLLTGTGGTLQEASTQEQKGQFILAVPSNPAPAGGYPVAIFAHGLAQSRVSMLPLANALASGGFASIAIDAVFHGERSRCTEDAHCAQTPHAQVCDVPSGRCQAANRPANATACAYGAADSDLPCFAASQGLCLPDNRCEGGTFALNASGQVAISSAGFLNTDNFIVTRDNWIHTVPDHAQLIRIIKGTGTGSLAESAGVSFNGEQLHYVGMSLGGFNGVLVSSVSPDLHKVALNTPGADPVEIVMTSPAFAAQREALVQPPPTGEGPLGTPEFDQKLSVARWILEPADPQTSAFRANNPAAPADRELFIQYITDDPVIPNPVTVELIRAANQNASKQVDVFRFEPLVEDLPLMDRHGFLLNFVNPAVTTQAQGQVVNFLNTGTP